MNRVRLVKWILGLLIAAVLIAVILYIGLTVKFFIDANKVRVTSFPSSIGQEKIVFFMNGFVNYTTYMAVDPDPNIYGNEFLIGRVGASDSARHLFGIYMSKDGTVIAARTTVFKETGKEHPLTHAYDFKVKKIIAPGVFKSKNPVEQWEYLSATISKLLQDRGGIETLAEGKDCYSSFKRLNSFKSKQWRQQWKKRIDDYWDSY